MGTLIIQSNSEMQNTALEHMSTFFSNFSDASLHNIPQLIILKIRSRVLEANSWSYFYGSLPHINLVQDPIKSIAPNSILTESTIERPVDRIILATGFDTGFRPQYILRSKGGINLRDMWVQKPKGAIELSAYMSIVLAGFLNMFLMGSGLGIPYANGSILLHMEAQADYVVACLAKMQKQDIKTMEVDRDAQNKYNIQQTLSLEDLIWLDHCSSWYKGGTVDGEPFALYGGSKLQYKELLSSPRWEDWKFIPLYNNQFAFLGNGESLVKAMGGDKAYYFTLENCANILTTGDFQAE
ncbi:hypothetical protein IW261DRAFT_1565074 [Armillaria novae-zelandiae]|uniref:Uncharacterized protein n=1 Tax=Armillaria novae-zelandiae TaxID=153914 RepID=A0AA39P7P0_9AGAR|nr:hypothetical protein IW261DRAFT_1565074 [Armillaria novae-zelandiae]